MISVSILGIKDPKKYEIIDKTSCNYIHIDIMDGIFVSNKHEYTDLYRFTHPTEIHLMVDDVKSYIDKYKDLKPEYIIFHIESKQDILELINQIKSYGIKVGIAINPNTDISVLIPYLKHIEQILVMSVEPGYGGQEYIISTMDKVEELIKLRKQLDLDFFIEVDGGINPNTILGDNAEKKVVGNSITSKIDYQKQIDLLNKLIEIKKYH